MLILSRYGDEFGQKLFERVKDYKEGVQHFPFNYRVFPDDESLVRFSDPPLYSVKKGEVWFPPGSEKIRAAVKNDSSVVFVNRGASGRNWKPVHELLNAQFATQYLKDKNQGFGAERVCLIIPNMPFAKQDKIFYDDKGNMFDGQPITITYAREMLRKHADLLINITPHDFRKTGWIMKNEKMAPELKIDAQGRVLDAKGRVILPFTEDLTNFAYAIDVTPELVEHVFSGLGNPYVIGGDKSVKSAILSIKERYANVDGTVAQKLRDRNFNEMLETSIGDLPADLSRYDIVLLDDVAITGGTMVGALKEIKKRNPRSITCAAVHGEFSYNKYGSSGLDVLKQEGADVVVTNTMETPVSKVDVTGQLAEKLYELY